jgi:uncharacterized protein
MNTKIFIGALALMCGAALAQAPSGVIRSNQPGGNHPMRTPNLPDMEGAVPWSVLNSVKIKNEGGKLLPDYTPQIKSFNAKRVKVQGFMIPLQPGDKQTHFLITNVPTTCGFCMPAGPEGLIEVRTAEAVKYNYEPITLEGRFAVLDRDPTGVYYRLTGAKSIESK